MTRGMKLVPFYRHKLALLFKLRSEFDLYPNFFLWITDSQDSKNANSSVKKWNLY